MAKSYFLKLPLKVTITKIYYEKLSLKTVMKKKAV